MRVALVTSLVAPIRSAEANGPHAVVVDLARGLARRGHRVSVYAAAGSVAEGCDIVEVPVAAAAADAAVQVGKVPSSAALRALDRGFERLVERVRADAPDVVSQHAFDSGALELAEGLPVIHTLHLPPSAEMVDAVRAAAGEMATVSRASQGAWEAATGRPIGLLPNGVRELEPAVRATVPVALIAGRITPEKGTDVAIRVARRAGLAVIVAGDVYDAAYHASRVRPLLGPNEWIGPISRDELFQLMARCAVVLMPVAWDEPFGLVAAEAQMAGCPVVAYRRGALPEVVCHGIGGWIVDPGDEDALVRGVHRARGLDRDAIRSRARRKLGVARMVDAYEDALARAAGTKSRGPASDRAMASVPVHATATVARVDEGAVSGGRNQLSSSVTRSGSP